MKRKTIYIVFGVIVLCALFVAVKERTLAPISNASLSYVNTKLGFTFAYPDQYVLEERPTEQDKDLLLSLVLIRKEDKDNMKSIPVGGEFLPIMTVYVLKNVAMQQAGIWAQKHPSYSNFNLLTGEVSEQSVGGAQTLRYTADGLYQSDNAVVAHGGLIYVFSGAYTSTTTAIHRDYAALLNTIQFIPAAVSGTPFDQTGNIVIDNPGLESNVWHLVYELPGKPGLSVKLLIPSTIRCQEGGKTVLCDSFLTQGARVRVIGTEQGGAVTIEQLVR